MKINKKTTHKLKAAMLLTCLGILASFFLSAYVSLILSKQEVTAYSFLPHAIIISMIEDKFRLLLFASLLLISLMCVFLVIINTGNESFSSELDKITDYIETPKSIGQGQHGAARWLSDNEIDRVFDIWMLDWRSNKRPERGGMVVGYKNIKGREKLYCLEDDVHSLILGATRCGKTRGLMLQSICHIALSGESMIIPDPKGEVCDYTLPYLEKLGYEVITLDFKNPRKSMRYNFLQPVIDAVKQDDNAKAIDLIWDITSSLVGEPKGERIWNNGEASVIAGSIMSIIFDNMDKPEHQNFTNVYFFINHMCKSGEKGEMPLDKYINGLPDTHPAKGLFGVALLAPARTRGSFFTSALATLRLFTNPNIYNMSKESEFDLSDTGKQRRAVFIILPDSRLTYHGIASLFVYQQYTALVDTADERGGRLKKRVNFLLEEFGNFTKIPAFSNMLTVGGGRGIRFNLVIQSFSQIEEKYGKEQAETVKDNCHCFIYLHSENPNTNAEISKRLGKYTTLSYGRSHSTSSRNGSSSSSMNLIGRELLTPDEVRMINRPNLLVMLSGCHPVIMQMPDISKWKFNAMLGMGDMEHNTKLRMARQALRPERKCDEIKLWGIWKQQKYQTSGNTSNGIPPVQNLMDFPETTFEDELVFDREEQDAITEAVPMESSDARWEEINKYD